ncbi:MAG: hypothetical protein HC858_13000 [Brachymonas sp.]|nr:hypothetical protein [Brachymonas sp.]
MLTMVGVDAVHVAAPRALFEACAAAHVARVVHISAMGAGHATPIAGRYMASKRAAEAALIQAMAGSRGDAVIVRSFAFDGCGQPLHPTV